MINVRWWRDEKVNSFESVEDFLETIFNDEMVMDFLGDIYPKVEIPIIGEVNYGELIYRYTENGTCYPWDELVKDMFDSELNYISEVLEDSGKIDYRGWEIEDTEFNEED